MFACIWFDIYIYTADFIKMILVVYTHSMTTIYLSLTAQVAKSTFLMKSSVSVDFMDINVAGSDP